MSHRIARFRKSERGGALLELAVAMPLLILMCVGIMDYGRVFFTSIAVSNAARAGAEWGAQGEGVFSGSEYYTKMGDFAKLEGDPDAGTITVTAVRICRCLGTTVVPCSTTCAGGYGPAAQYIEVTATKTVTLLIKYPGLPTSIPIARTAIFRAT